MTQFSIYYFSASQVLLLLLCYILSNTRDVTPKQTDGAVPIFLSAVSSRYQHADCCFEHRFKYLPQRLVLYCSKSEGWQL